MFISNQELKTHLYGESVEAITDGDDTILTAAVDGAVVEAKGYLAAFDRTAIFEATGSSRNPLLLIFIKDIAVWHFINLCNAGTDLKLRQDRYERAINWLKAIQKGDVSPDFPTDAGAGGEGAGIIKFGSNPKKIQHF